VLRRVFRGKFVAGLRQAFQLGQLNFHGNLTLLAQPKTFAAWLRPLYRNDWIVYLKPPFGGPEYVLQYLGRYTHRVAISNHRLVSLAEGNVFREVLITSNQPDSAASTFQTYAIKGISGGVLEPSAPSGLPVRLHSAENIEKLFDGDFEGFSAANEKADALLADYRREGFGNL
jgi:hypothetical protein